LLAHRLVNPECRDVVALVQLDSDRIIKGPLKHWSACFPMAYSANLNGCVLNEGSGEILRRVTNLSLDNASLPISFFDQEFPHLFNLSVVGCKLTDAHLERFNCPNLTALDMTGCHTLTGTSLHMLNSDKLASLSLRSCFNITDVGLQDLQCPNLIYLNLMSCWSLSDDALATICCPYLTTLSLSGIAGITDVGLEALDCPQLTRLEITFCTGITDVGLRALKCPHLDTLYFGDCVGITVPENMWDSGQAQGALDYVRESVWLI